MLIDSHHHLWRYNDRDYVWMNRAMDALRRDFLVPELEAVMREGGVAGTVAVQARSMTEETNFLLEISTGHPFVLGVVGWVPLVDPEVETELERVAAHPKLCAIRHVLHDEPDDFYMLREDFNRGVRLLEARGLAYDLLIFERHLPQTIHFVDRHPRQVFVVDHVAKPRIRERLLSPWREQMIELARRENVYCKVSGMATEADWQNWDGTQLRPYFDVVLAAFGPGRLMFGSDWPVLTLAGSYGRWVETFRSWIAELSADEQEQISSKTAQSAYRLKGRTK